jgi:hypothetical protein
MTPQPNCCIGAFWTCSRRTLSLLETFAQRDRVGDVERGIEDVEGWLSVQAFPDPDNRAPLETVRQRLQTPQAAATPP